jgi:hypothetical protein
MNVPIGGMIIRFFKASELILPGANKQLYRFMQYELRSIICFFLTFFDQQEDEANNASLLILILVSLQKSLSLA